LNQKLGGLLDTVGIEVKETVPSPMLLADGEGRTPYPTLDLQPSGEPPNEAGLPGAQRATKIEYDPRPAKTAQTNSELLCVPRRRALEDA
jgi:hypothetical protein